MSKSTPQTLLLPGEAGWEVWTRQPNGEVVLAHATEHKQVGDIEGLPAAELTLFFPAKALIAVPMRVMSGDDALFSDLATLHAERLGLRPDPLAGQLMDCFVAERGDDSSTLLAVFLRPPGEGDLPQRGPRAFDLSARARQVDGDTLVVWKELGRWVFALYQHGRLLFFQATAVDAAIPDQSLVREIKLSLMQLSMQQLHPEVSRIEVWSDDSGLDSSALAGAFDPPVVVVPRPQPALPAAMSKLLPEDVRAARDVARRKRSIIAAVAAVVLAYAGVVGWLGFGLWQGSSEVAEMRRMATEAAPEGKAYAAHMAKWNELADAIDVNRSPVEILHRISSCIPSSGGLRLKKADISPYEASLSGEAPDLPPVARFSLNLTKHNGLTRFDWATPNSKQSTRGWEFNYNGVMPAEGSQP